LAEAVGRDQDDVAWCLEELERHERLDRPTIALPGPSPIEVAQGLEGSDMGLCQAPLERATGALLFFPVEESGNPRCLVDLLPMGEQAMKMQGLGADLQGIKISPHRGSP